MKLQLVHIFTLLVCGLLSHVGRADEPNIIFIMADDLGWKDVGYAGAEFFETPHIDRLASQGMTFSAAYSGGPNCSPTRACVMTGTYTPRHHIYTPGGRSKGNPEYMRLLVPAINRKDKTLARQGRRTVPHHQFARSRIRLHPGSAQDGGLYIGAAGQVASGRRHTGV